MKTSTFISHYNCFYLAFCFLWPVIWAYYLHIDAAGRMLLLFSIIALLLNFGEFKKKKRHFGSAAFVCWTILVVYSFVNSMVKGFVSEFGALSFIQNNFLIPFVFLFVTIVQIDNDPFRCLNVLLLVQLVYLVIGASHISLMLFDERSGNNELGNALPTVASTCAFVASLLFCDRKLKGGWIVYLIIITFVLAIIVICATRKALGALVLILIGMMLGRFQKLNLKSIFVCFLAAIVMFIGLQRIMDNTLIGTRLEERSDTFNVPLSSNQQVNDFLMLLLDDRALQYYECINIHHEYPLTGVGLLNYVVINNANFRLHSEYLVHYYENGIIGLILLLLFYFILLKRLNQKRKTGDNIFLKLFGLLSVLFLNLTTWTYNSLNVMLVYAVVITQSYFLKTEPIVTITDQNENA